MCGAIHEEIAFLKVDGSGNISSQHDFLVMGAIRQSGDAAYMQPLMSSKWLADMANENLMHMGWLARIYNNNISAVATTQIGANDVIVGNFTSMPGSPNTIFPVEAAKYVPRNNYFKEGIYPATKFVSDATGCVFIVVLQCKQKPNAQ